MSTENRRPLGRLAPWFTHSVFSTALAALVTVGIFSPWFPGRYDPVALPLSVTLQLLVLCGILLVPITLLVSISKFGISRLLGGAPLQPGRGNPWALGLLVTASFQVAAVVLVVFFAFSPVMALVLIAAWCLVPGRLFTRWRKNRNSPSWPSRPVAVSLAAVPAIVLGLEIALAELAVEFSRNRAISNATGLIAAIERHHAEYGELPDSLISVWKDESPGVAGIAQYHYSPDGDSYNLIFEQPHLLIDNIGVREFVVYHPKDGHLMPSHDSWILIWSRDQIRANQGWHESLTTVHPHWKIFLFD